MLYKMTAMENDGYRVPAGYRVQHIYIYIFFFWGGGGCRRCRRGSLHLCGALFASLLVQACGHLTQIQSFALNPKRSRIEEVFYASGGVCLIGNSVLDAFNMQRFCSEF